jgi:hypothetical protein
MQKELKLRREVSEIHQIRPAATPVLSKAIKSSDKPPNYVPKKKVASKRLSASKEDQNKENEPTSCQKKQVVKRHTKLAAKEVAKEVVL